MGAVVTARGYAWTVVRDANQHVLILRSDGTPSGTVVAVDVTAVLNVPATSSLPECHAIGDRISLLAHGGIFTAGGYLVSSDGTPSGTKVVMSVSGLNDASFGGVSDRVAVFVVAHQYGRDHYYYDGDRLLGSLGPGDVRMLGGIGRTLIYSSQFVFGNSLWASDGGAPVQLASLNGVAYGPGGSCSWKRGIAFQVLAPDGIAIWTTDGTVANTTLLTSPSLTEPSVSLFAAGDALVIWATDAQGTTFSKNVSGRQNDQQRICSVQGASPGSGIAGVALRATAAVVPLSTSATGVEPWLLDLTANSCTIIADIATGPNNSVGGIIPLTHGQRCRHLPFRANDGLAGDELWVTDGSAAGTKLVADLAPGAASSAPRDFVRVGDKVFFAASNGLWVAPITLFGAQGVDDLGGGCAIPSGTGPFLDPDQTEAVLGLTCTLALASAPPNANAIFVLSADSSAVTLWNACTLHLGSAHVEWSATTDGTGRVTQSFPVPTVPELLGAKLTVQCGVITSPQSAVLSNALQLVFGLP